MLHRYISSKASSLAFDYDREGYWYPVRVSNMALAYNPEKTKKTASPIP
jgi:iron(III) transport system substrate-binding protein